MVTINNIYGDVSKNGLGNRLFQYCWARDIAEKNNYKLIVDPIMGFPITYNPTGEIILSHNQLITPPATQIFNIEQIFNHKGHIIVYGYPQRYEYYINNKENIKKWLYIENEEIYDTPSVDDLVINIRLGDYVRLGWDLDIKYYINILKKETFKNAIIICDEPNNPKLIPLKEIGCVVKDNSNHGRLKFLADSKKCIISNSTFSWWATFLGEGIVYFPCFKFPWISNPGKDDVDLRVYDEDRYKFIYSY